MSSSQDQLPRLENEAFARASAINSCFSTCAALLNSGVFSKDGYQPILFEAAVVNLLINLNDLVQKAAKDGKRIASTEHVEITDGVADVTDLISKCRNAACHIGSSLQDVNTNLVRFAVARGKSTVMQFAGTALESEFEDDIAIFYGAYRLYVRRNIITALKLIEQAYPDEVAVDWMRRLQRKAQGA